MRVRSSHRRTLLPHLANVRIAQDGEILSFVSYQKAHPTMLDTLRDPLWQFVGAVLTVLALVATFVVYSLQRQLKAVSYDILSRTILLTVREELEGKLEVRYEGHLIRSLSVLVVKVWNSGNQPIRSDDYERPISFCVGQSAHILSADITSVEPSSVSTHANSSDNIVTLSPALLNPGDSITMKLLVRDADGRLCPDARIVGVKAIQRASPKNRQFAIASSAGMVLLAFGAYLLITSRPPAAPTPPMEPVGWVGIGIASIGYVLLLWALLASSRIRLYLRRLRAAG